MWASEHPAAARITMFREMSTMVFGGADDIWGEEGKMEVGTRLQARSSMSDDFRTGKITEVHDYGACELSFRPSASCFALREPRRC